MQKRTILALLWSVILTASLCGSSLATMVGWGNPELELANPLIGPHSQLPQGLGGIPYSEPGGPLGNPLGETFLLGTTWYDYQHNGTIGKMVAMASSGSGGVHFCWMNGLELGAATRHVYYNYFNPSTGALAWPDVGYQVDMSTRAGYTTISNLSGGEAVVSFHQGSPTTSAVAYDFIEGFGAFQVVDIPSLSGWEDTIWPHMTVCHQNYIHVVSCEARGEVWQRIAYARSGDGGSTYTPFTVVDTIVSISQMCAASPVSNKVGIAYTKSYFDVMNMGPYAGLLVGQLNNGITLIESDDGVTWDFSAKQDITKLIEPDTTRWPDITYANGDTLRAYCDVDLLYDQSDNAHAAFTTKGLWFDALLYAQNEFAITRMALDASMIWHWSEDHDTLTVIADGWYDVGDPDVPANEYRGSGTWRSTVDRPSLAQDATTGYLYCLYVRCVQGDTSGGPAPSHGWANGEIYCSVSTDGGLNWSEGTNLTNTPSPNATAGNCMDEDYPSLATVVNDTLHIIYVEDKDAGGVVQTAPQEGVWTENPVKYQKVPASLVPPGPPYMSNYYFHVGPPPVPVVLASFQATGGQGHIALNWVTASEINCHKWEIYRSKREDGEYAKMGDLPGHSSTETAHTYQWVDRQVDAGATYYYKLKQVDFDGSFWWSHSVSATATTTVPKTYTLHQNYPNPFNPITEIRYAIPRDEQVTLKVYNILGAEVATLVDADQEANFYTVRWDAENLASGVYFCRLKVGDFEKTIKMVLLK